eukprot:COSAG01_NODE_54914_length_329_cov_0.452174_1_plen_59_part_01
MSPRTRAGFPYVATRESHRELRCMTLIIISVTHHKVLYIGFLEKIFIETTFHYIYRLYP